MCTRAGVRLDLCQRGLVQMALMIPVCPSWNLLPSEMFNRNHDAPQSLVVSRTTSPALQSWRMRQKLASGLVVAESIEPLDFQVAPVPSRLQQNNSSPQDDQIRHLRVRQSARPSLTRISAALWEVETPEIDGPSRKERSSDQHFHEYPERIQSCVARAKVFVDVMLGRLSEEGVPPCAHI